MTEAELEFNAIIIRNSSDTDSTSFYDELSAHISSLGWNASFCEIFESPHLSADLWVSCDAHVLNNAPVFVKTVELSSDKMTDDIKENITTATNKIRRLAEFQDRIIRLAEKLSLK